MKFFNLFSSHHGIVIDFDFRVLFHPAADSREGDAIFFCELCLRLTILMERDYAFLETFIIFFGEVDINIYLLIRCVNNCIIFYLLCLLF